MRNYLENCQEPNARPHPWEVTPLSEINPSMAPKNTTQELTFKTKTSFVQRTHCPHCLGTRHRLLSWCPRVPSDQMSLLKDNATLGSQPLATLQGYYFSPPLRADEMSFATPLGEWHLSQQRVSLEAIFMRRFIKATAGLMNHHNPRSP